MNSLIYTALCATVDSLIHIVNVFTASQTIIQMLKYIIKPRNQDIEKTRISIKCAEIRLEGNFKNADFRINAEISQPCFDHMTHF